MSAPIGPGDWVECMSTGRGSPDHVEAGRVYRVEGFAPMRGCRVCRQCLEGLVLNTDKDRGDGWCITRFRPIDRRTTELFRSWLTDLPSDLEEREGEFVGVAQSQPCAETGAHIPSSPDTQHSDGKGNP